jgi:hypothetical protein
MGCLTVLRVRCRDSSKSVITAEPDVRVTLGYIYLGKYRKLPERRIRLVNPPDGEAARGTHHRKTRLTKWDTYSSRTMDFKSNGLTRASACALMVLTVPAFADTSPRVCFSAPAQAYLDTQTNIYYRSPPDGYSEYLDCSVFAAQPDGQQLPSSPAYYSSPPVMYYNVPPGVVWFGGAGRDRDRDRPSHGRNDQDHGHGDHGSVPSRSPGPPGPGGPDPRAIHGHRPATPQQQPAPTGTPSAVQGGPRGGTNVH